MNIFISCRHEMHCTTVHWGGEWGGVSPPQPTRGYGGALVRGGAPAENDFGASWRKHDVIVM